jgi:hypothetical protein
MADSKVTALTEDATPGGDSLVYTVDAPGGTPVSRKTELSDLYKGLAVDSQGFATNYTIATSRTGNAETIALKTKAGTDATATDPILIAFRNATAGTGDYTIITVTAATSITINSTATMGMTNSVPARLWLVGFNDAGTFRLGVVNCLTTTGIFPLQDNDLQSSTAISTSADNAGVIYTGTAVTTKAMRVLGYLTYNLASVGVWNTAQTKIQLFEYGVPLPGKVIQKKYTQSGEVQTGTTTIPNDDTIPQSSEGNEFFTLAITPTDSANLLEIDSSIVISSNISGAWLAQALFQDSTANSLAASMAYSAGASQTVNLKMTHTMQAGTASSTTFKIRAGAGGAGTVTLNGYAAGRIFGGVMSSSLRVAEISV